MAVVLEVWVAQERDVPGAVEGGADRLHLAGPGELSPEISTVSAVCRETEVPVFVLLRLNDSWTTTGGELTRLVGLAESYLNVGAQGLVLGFLDADLLVDEEVCGHLAGQLPGVPWTFSRAIDASLESDRVWRQVVRLPGVDAVHSAGSPRGLGAGFDDLVDRAAADEDVARLLLAGGGLRAEHVPWLLRAGVRQFHVGGSARPGGSWDKAYVDAGLVRSWRMLLDDAADRAAGAR